MTTPMEQIELDAKMMQDEEKALPAISRARARLVLGNTPEMAFFASICMGWRLQVAWWMPTMAVDGTHLFYNPSFVNTLTDDELRAVIVHEALHDALGHHCRMAGLDRQDANIAADLAINHIVTEAGFKLPKGAVHAGEGPFVKMPKGKSLEEYYALLPKRKKSKGDGDGDDPGRCGGILPPGDGSDADRRLTEQECKMRVAQARDLAKQQKGNTPGWLDGLVHDVLEPKVNWRHVLRRFLTERAKSDYSWTPPNRRFLSQGHYLPGCMSESVGHIVISVDASGSCWSKEVLSRFAGEVNGILASYSVTLTVMYNDTRVVDSFEWAPGRGPLTLEPKGGGGTCHKCVFEWIRDKNILPACLVCLTDMCTSFPVSAPEYPVLWCSVSKGVPAPWGHLVEVDL